MSSHSTSKTMIMILILGFSFMATAQDVRRPETQVVDLLKKFPAQNTRERDRLAGEVVRLGPKAVAEICRMLLPRI